MKSIREIMTTNVDYCTTLDNVYEAAVKMAEGDVGAIPICQESKLVGVLTDRDIAIRCVAGKKPGSTKITDVMTKVPITISPETSVTEAEDLMAEKQIRRLFVVEQDSLIGVVSLGDLAVHKDTNMAAAHALTEISENQHIQH
ncbi:CBS domain-containing protein [Peribacillus huizhouensis]|uniref:CBS domain-containing protein n=1 Tax=Peribacillus huizhouensis TaxID=1501239 RepID=A0ABR6CPP1_9BACI|nr:CBS domain-containing protein [Peribacillus huizhouensis]MBA9026995.1 CBS domain-containing protein [Peribacillus huizhouensis]